MSYIPKINQVIASIILMANVYFVPETVWHFNHFGGPYYTIIPFLISLCINAMIFSSLLAFNRSLSKSKTLLVIHIVGIIFIALYAYMEIAVYYDH